MISFCFIIKRGFIYVNWEREINWIDNLDIVVGDFFYWNGVIVLYIVCKYVLIDIYIGFSYRL